MLLPAREFAMLKASTAQDLKQFLLTHAAQRALCELDDAGLDLDLDQPEDYRRAFDRDFKSAVARL